jgi:PTS system ascorbate-specific IIC component
MSPILEFLVQFATQPAIVLGLVAFVGLLAQRKTVQQLVDGTVKTILGYLIMSIGIGGIVGALGPINSMFGQAFQLEGFFRLDEPVVAAVAPTLGTQTALILSLGFLLSVVLARITPLKYIYLTGHHLWVHAGEVAILMWSLGLSGPTLLIAGTILFGFYLVLSPAVFQPLMRQLTGGDEFGLAHGNMTKYWISVKFATLFGKDKVDMEEMPVPRGLEFFRDMAIGMAIIMLIVTIPSALVAGPAWVEAELSNPAARREDVDCRVGASIPWHLPEDRSRCHPCAGLPDHYPLRTNFGYPWHGRGYHRTVCGGIHLGCYRLANSHTEYDRLFLWRRPRSRRS